ncbi:MAG: PA14 domain-containing protein, partial [Anaerolineae bacterium]
MNPKTFFRLTLLLVLILALPGATALADSPAPVNWTAHYYSNPGLSGEPAKTVTETAIDYDWGFNAPADGLPADNFSVRWTGSATFEAGDYTFSVTVDDGARVWLDGDLLIDEWRRQAPTTFTAQTRLSAGTHQIQMAYFEATGTAVAKLWWRFDAPAPAPGPAPTEPPASIDWQVEYFNNPSLLGAPTATGQVSAIDYDWGFNAPVDGLPADNFSVRWTGSAAFGAGDYTFSVTADDGVRVWLDDQMLIDEWREQAATTFTASTHLGAGTHQIKVAHYEATGAAVIKFWWRQDAANGVTPTPTPSAPSAQKLLIDNL